MKPRYYDYVFIVFFCMAFYSFSMGFRGSINAYVIMSESNYCDSSGCFRLCSGVGDCLVDEVCCLRQTCNSQQRCNVQPDVGVCMPKDDCTTASFELDLPDNVDPDVRFPEVQNPINVERSRAGILLFLLVMTCIVGVGYLYYRNKSEE